MLRALALACLLVAVPAAAQQPSIEHEVKAAFLYNFVRFVEWPATAFETSRSPLALCLAGTDVFGPVLDELVRNEEVGGRPLAVRRLAAAEPVVQCHLLFVSPSERGRFAAILGRVNTRQVLTVSDSLDFLDAGGHISFFMDSNRVRFAINADTVRAAEFRIDSRLMRLARIHKAAPGAPR